VTFIGGEMARRMKPVPGSRGERVQQIKDAVEREAGRELTVGEVAGRLNAIAKSLHFEEGWSGPRFSKMVHGQEPSLEDAACLLALDPEHRSWSWLVFGGAPKGISAAMFRKIGG
jgi:hypothetical protein